MVLPRCPHGGPCPDCHGPADRVHGVLAFTRDVPPFDAFRDPRAQRELVTARFPERARHLPRLVEAMRDADDLFFDIVGQIRLPAWSRGRVLFAGDAAPATSLLSGQGSSVAPVGACVLADELATRSDHIAAFAAHERRMRPFAERSQGPATRGSTMVTSAKRRQLGARKALLREPDSVAREVATASARAGRATHGDLLLPD
ncbi:hypothetical protein AB0L80_15800 [Streptomyces sp. NPDC052069]|uniref:hypothetical protein n=1 Tax=Streptomyces sp. NPDC052069 TaxID=3154650 RepID=UPI00342966A9